MDLFAESAHDVIGQGARARLAMGGIGADGGIGIGRAKLSLFVLFFDTVIGGVFCVFGDGAGRAVRVG